MRIHQLLPAALLFLSLAACRSEAFYGVSDAMGVPRGEILSRRVTEAREQLATAKVECVAAADRFAQVRPDDIGIQRLRDDLGSVVRRVRDAHEDVVDDIKSVDSAASTLFERWREEGAQYHDPSLRKASEKRQQGVKDAYLVLWKKLGDAKAALEEARNGMEDQVLYLKHNPDAKGVAQVADKASALKRKADAVVREYDDVAAEAGRFLETLGSAKGK